MAHEIQGKQLK